MSAVGVFTLEAASKFAIREAAEKFDKPLDDM
jgi:hypothetical protein